MQYDFDTIVSRRGTDCEKWDLPAEDGVLPLWVADMDFPAAPCILKAMQKRMDHGVFGYTCVPREYYECVRDWFSRRHGWSPDPSWMIYTTGVVPGIAAVIKALTEHYSKSKEEGSVASIGFVKGGVEAMLNKVPANRLILGVPFFARKWMVNEPHAEGDPVPNEAAGMDTIKKFIKDNGGTAEWDETCGQNYAEVTVEGKLVKIWVEDTESMKLKLDVMKDNGLAGCSAWRLGMESKDVWTLIQSYFTKD